MPKQPWREWDREALWRKLQEAQVRVAELKAEIDDQDEPGACGHSSRFTEWGDPAPTGDSDEWCVMCALEEESDARIALLRAKEESPDIWKILPVECGGEPGMTWKQYAEHLEPGGWQPIESVVRDGNWWLVGREIRLGESLLPVPGAWSPHAGRSGAWIDLNGDAFPTDRPLFVMPLPAPPQAETSEAAPAGAEGGEVIR